MILWCGGEDVDFPNGGSVTPSTTSGYFRAGYARCALTNSGSQMISAAFPGGLVTSVWLSVQYYRASNVATWIIGLSGGTNFPSGLYIYDNGGGVQLNNVYSSAGHVLASESGSSINGTGVMYKLDMHVLNYGASSTVTIYVNGATTPVVNYSGSTAISGMSGYDRVGTGNSLGNSWFSEWIVADEDTRTMSLVTMAPNGAGTTDLWTGTYTNVNPVTINDASYVNTNVTGQDEQFNVIDLPSGTWTVKAVKAVARAAVSAGSPTATQLAIGVNSGGTVNVGSNIALTGSFVNYERLMTTNPVSGSAWAQSDMNPLQIDLRSA